MAERQIFGIDAAPRLDFGNTNALPVLVVGAFLWKSSPHNIGGIAGYSKAGASSRPFGGAADSSTAIRNSSRNPRCADAGNRSDLLANSRSEPCFRSITRSFSNRDRHKENRFGN